MGRAGRRVASLTEWMIDEEELAEKVSLALARIEAENYRRFVRDLFPYRREQEYLRSPTVEEVAGEAGISPARALDVARKHGKKYGVKRIKCPSRSRLGWCLRHENLRDGVALVDPELARLADELWRIRHLVRACTGSSITLPGTAGPEPPCNLTRKGLAALITRAAIIADELGIDDEEKLIEWLGLTKKKIAVYINPETGETP